MKCPRCEYSFSSNRDVCPRCELDVAQWAARRGRAGSRKKSARSARRRVRSNIETEPRKSLASEKRDSLKQDVADLVDGLNEIRKKSRLCIKNTSETVESRSVIPNPNSYDAIKAEWDRLDEDAIADRPELTRGTFSPLDISFTELVVDHRSHSILESHKLQKSATTQKPATRENVTQKSAKQGPAEQEIVAQKEDIKASPKDERHISYLDLRNFRKPIREELTSGVKKSTMPQGKSLEELTQVIERVSDDKSPTARTKRQKAEFEKLSAVFKTRNADSSGNHPVVTPKD